MSYKTKNISQEPVRLGETIAELINQGIGNPVASQTETDRKQRAELVDVDNAVRDTTEQRSDLIERTQEGEDIDPDVMHYSGVLALEARVQQQGLQAKDGENNNP